VFPSRRWAWSLGFPVERGSMKRLQTLTVLSTVLMLCLLLVSACALETKTSTTTTAASVQPPAGFVRYSGGGAEIYLPPYFDWDLNDPTTVSSLQDPGGPSTLEDLVGGDVPIVAFASSSTDWRDFGFVTAMLESPGPEEVPLEKFVDGLGWVLEGGRLLSRSDLTIGGLEATRLVVEIDWYSSAAFIVAAPDGYWIINYNVSSSWFPDRLADFDASAAAFRIVP